MENKEYPWKQCSAVQTDRGRIRIRTSRKSVQSWLKRNESSKMGNNRDAGSLEEAECKQRSKLKPKILGKQSFSSILLEICDLTGEKTDFPPVNPAPLASFRRLKEADLIGLWVYSPPAPVAASPPTSHSGGLTGDHGKCWNPNLNLSSAVFDQRENHRCYALVPVLVRVSVAASRPPTC